MTEREVAVVTGGAQGIGLAIGRRLAERYEVVALDVVPGDTGGRAGIGWVECDVSDAAAVRAAIGTCRVPPTVAVHCAAVQHMTPFDALGAEEWERTWRVNVSGAVHLVQSVAPGMRAAGRGRIVLLSSSSMLTPPAGMAHYIATKSALVGLARGLATEYGGDGITVNVVAPGLTATANAVAGVPAEHFDLVRSRQAIPRTGTPEDQAGAVAFLVSEDAAFITGQTVMVDGGEGRL